ncbi:MAG TPA: VTT domain-containing protein [Candidatus Paceibacterota bacterium]|jgi:membrane protein DedA with SNARE-associated domain
MIEQSVTYIQSVIVAYGAWGVFWATIVEEVVAPIPSALVPLAAGFFLLPATASFPLVALESIFLVAIPVALGISLGSAAFYAVAYYGGKPIIEKTRKMTGVSWHDIERIERKMTRGKRDEVMLFLLRLVPIIPGFALSGFCGVVRYPFSRFLVLTFLGSLLRAYGLGLLGWKTGEYYIKYVDVMDQLEGTILAATLLLLALAALGYYLFVRSKNAR